MLERLSIRNFQRHERLGIKFDPQITTIVGPSDSGKSSVIRALRWLAFNRPLGTGYIRDGEDGCSAKIRIDGRDVKRKRGKAENSYWIGERALAAVGTDVPEDVARLLNLSAENFAMQHDAPFWFSLTAGELAKQLNRIVDLGVIDGVAAELAFRIRAARAEAGVVEKRLAEAGRDVDRLAHVPDMAADLEAVEDLAEDAASRRAVGAALRAARDGAVELQGQAERLSGAASGADAARLRGAIAVKRAGWAESLREIVESIRSAKRSVAVEVPDMAELEMRKTEVNNRAEVVAGLVDLLGELRGAKAMQDSIRTEAEEAEKQFRAEVGDRCPLCGGKTK